MKHHIFTMRSLICACVMLAGVALSAEDDAAPVAGNAASMTPPQPNKVKVAKVSSQWIKAAEAKEYVLDLEKVPPPYRNEIKFYTVNALHSVGLKEVASSDLVIKVELIDSHFNVVPVNPRKERKSVQYVITASEKGSMIWTASSSCSSRATEISNYWFPGLVASILPNFGKSHGGPLSIGKYPIYLNAVNTPPAGN